MNRLETSIVDTRKHGKHTIDFHDITLHHRVHESKCYGLQGLNALHKEMVVIDGEFYGGTIYIQKLEDTGRFWGSMRFETLSDHPWGGDFETKLFDDFSECKEHHRKSAAKQTKHTLEYHKEPVTEQLIKRHNLYDEDFHKQSLIARMALIYLCKPDTLESRGDGCLVRDGAAEKFRELSRPSVNTDFSLTTRTADVWRGSKFKWRYGGYVGTDQNPQMWEQKQDIFCLNVYKDPMEILSLQIMDGQKPCVTEPGAADVVEAWDKAVKSVNERWEEDMRKLYESLRSQHNQLHGLENE